ncbi:MAG: VOC family protein [Gammaproteobacteria bacterium]|nr:VOC family protein [Gammaproteobacteria bacterium]
MAELGHIVLYVRDLEQSVNFYSAVVNLDVQGRIFDGRGALLSGGRTHHELLLIEVGDAPGPLTGRRLGLYHTGWKVGDSLDELRAARDRVNAHGTAIDGISDHVVSQSLYLRDPDGNEVELFVDDPNLDWRSNRDWLDTPVKPLKL